MKGKTECDHKNCTKTAVFFGFVGNYREKVCERHANTLKNTKFDISAMDFVEWEEDEAIFRLRTRLLSNANQKIDFLYEKLSKNWSLFLEKFDKKTDFSSNGLIEYALKRNSERYNAILRKLEGARDQIKQLVRRNEAILGAEEAVFCIVDTEFFPLHLTLEDWDWVSEGTDLEVYRSTGMEAMLCKDHPKALQFLLQTRHIQALTGTLQLDVSVAVGKLMAFFGEFSEAEAVILEDISRFGGLSLPLQVQLAEVVYIAGDWTRVVTICEEILNFSHQTETLTSLYYAINAYFHLGNPEKAVFLTETWTEKVALNTEIDKCIWSLITVEMMRNTGRILVSEYYKAVKTSRLMLPDSYMTVCALRRLGDLYMTEGDSVAAQTLYMKACLMHETHFPRSFEYGVCLRRQADIESERGNSQLASECFVAACRFFNANFPVSSEFAECLCASGDFHSSESQWSIAEQCYLRARDISHLTTFEPVAYAKLLRRIATLCSCQKRWNVAKELLMESCSVLRRSGERVELGCSWDVLASLCEETREWDLAERYYLLACNCCPVTDYRHTLYLSNLSNLYISTHRSSTVEFVCQTACQVTALHEPEPNEFHVATLRDLYS